MKDIRRFVLAIAIAVSVGPVVFAGGNAELPEIRVATDPTFAPMEFIDESGKLTGFDIDLMKAAAKGGGFSVTFVQVPWDSIFVGLAAGRYDAIAASITITEERKSSMDFSVPYLAVEQVVVAGAGARHVSSFRDLTGGTVGVLSGSKAALSIDQLSRLYSFRVRPYRDGVAYLSDLEAGTLPAAVMDRIWAESIIGVTEYADTLRIVETLPVQELYGVAVKRGNSRVLALIDGGLKKIVKSSELKRLEERWFSRVM